MRTCRTATSPPPATSPSRAQNLSQIDAITQSASQSGAQSLGFQLAFNSIGWKATNLLFNALDTLIGDPDDSGRVRRAAARRDARVRHQLARPCRRRHLRLGAASGRDLRARRQQRHLRSGRDLRRRRDERQRRPRQQHGRERRPRLRRRRHPRRRLHVAGHAVGRCAPAIASCLRTDSSTSSSARPAARRPAAW